MAAVVRVYDVRAQVVTPPTVRVYRVQAGTSGIAPRVRVYRLQVAAAGDIPTLFLYRWDGTEFQPVQHLRWDGTRYIAMTGLPPGTTGGVPTPGTGGLGFAPLGHAPLGG